MALPAPIAHHSILGAMLAPALLMAATGGAFIAGAGVTASVGAFVPSPRDIGASVSAVRFSGASVGGAAMVGAAAGGRVPCWKTLMKA